MKYSAERSLANYRKESTIPLTAKTIIMKKILYFSKLFSFYLLICYIFSSCASTHYKFSPVSKEDKKVIITISNGDTITHKLDMYYSDGKPAESIVVWSRQKLIWQIVNNPTVDSFKTMVKKKGDVFATQPHRKSKKIWKGKLKRVRYSDGPQEEEYDIEWIDKWGNPHPYDPFIQVLPK